MNAHARHAKHALHARKRKETVSARSGCVVGRGDDSPLDYRVGTTQELLHLSPLSPLGRGLGEGPGKTEAILDNEALLATCAYIALNLVAAGIAAAGRDESANVDSQARQAGEREGPSLVSPGQGSRRSRSRLDSGSTA